MNRFTRFAVTATLGIGALVIAISFIWERLFQFEPNPEDMHLVTAEDGVSPGGDQPSNNVEPETRSNEVPEKRWSPTGVEAAFLAASDYYAFVQDYFGLAAGGDPDSQYFVSKALGYCQMANYMFRDNMISLESAMTTLNNRPDYIKQGIAESHKRCEPFFAEGFDAYGDWQEFKKEAAAAKHPLAQSDIAAEQIVQPQLYDPAEAHKMLKEAVQSGHPEVVRQIAQVAPLGAIDSPTPVKAGAWFLLACERGNDCSADGEWKREICNVAEDCHFGETVVEMLRYRLGDHDFEEAQSIASELNASMNAGRWEELGLPNG